MSRFCDAIITINHEDYGNAKKMHCPKVYVIPSVGLDNHRFANLRINRDEYDIAARNPQPLEFRNKRIQSILKAHRINVLKDGNAPKRLRAFAAISLFGNRIALKVVVARNRKWKV